MDHRAPLQLLRSGVVAATVLFLAAIAHVAGGGGLPGPLILAALASVVWLPVTVLTRRQLSLPVLGGILGAGQAALHTTFMALAPAGSCRPGPSVRVGHHHSVSLAGCSSEGAVSMVPGMDENVTSVGMLTTHALAVALTALILARGEQALWQLLAWLTPFVLVPQPVTVPRLRPRPWFVSSHVMARQCPDTSGVGRRGPPLIVCSAVSFL